MLLSMEAYTQTDVCLFDVSQKQIEADIVATQTYSFEVLSSGTVSAGSMIVEFDTYHPKKEEFKAVITHPNGTTTVTIADLSNTGDLGNSDGSNYGSPNSKYVIYDAAANNMNISGDALPGNYKPQTGTFSTFDGMSVNGTWTISFTDKNGAFDNRGYVRNVFLKFDYENSCTEPSTSPSGLNITNVHSYQVDLSWTNNSGDGVVVVARKSSDGAIIPESGQTYTANSTFGLGDELRTIDNDCDYSGNFVVYKGSDNSATITGLTSGLSYSFDVYATDGTCINTTALCGSQVLPCPSSSDPPFSLPAKFRTCGSVSGTEVSDAGSLSFNIEVSGLSEPLDVSTNNLRQVKVYLKNGTNENLSLYSCTLSSPTAKTSSVIFTTGRFATSVSAAQITFRESARLNPPSSSAIIPYDIGLYRIETAGDFTSKFDGLANPNGTWTITFSETAGSTVDDLQIDYVELEFGPSFIETDISNYGANCDNAYELIEGTYISSNSNADTDDGNQPTRHVTCGDGISGCGCWNASYNEAQYLKFTATSSNFNMSISGIQASSGDIQVIVVEGNPTPCSGHGNWTVVTCPESSFENTTNSLDGRSHTGNGSIQNFDLSMDNAVIGNVYYIIIDGNMSATADYYINVTDGVASESTLPVVLLSFIAKQSEYGIDIMWETASEINNDYFVIERSKNAIDYENIVIIHGAGNSNTIKNYSYLDSPQYNGNLYYRLKQVDYDGTITYSNIVVINTCTTQITDFYANYYADLSEIHVFFNTQSISNYELFVYDNLGRIFYKKSGESTVGFNEAVINNIYLPNSSSIICIRIDGKQKSFRIIR